MLKRIILFFGLTAFMAVNGTVPVRADDEREYNDEYYDQIKIDRYLDAEIWTDHSDGDYYNGDNIVISFRTNRDAFVAVYSVDTKGRVNMLFPSGPGDDNYVRGGVTYNIPDGSDDFDFVVSGPDGVENVQIIASKERFPIPDWYPTSGLVSDWEDTHEYMDYLNGRYFVGYGGQHYAFNRTAIYINEWEPYYFRPVYYPDYPAWTVYGNAYIDYPWGGSIYINGVYWGSAPLYIPRIWVGWHTITVYDRYGYCWESDFHVSRYNTVVLNRTVINTSANVVSKYKEVRQVGYRDPVKAGYKDFKSKEAIYAGGSVSKSGASKGTVSKTTVIDNSVSKKYVRGSGEVKKTDRGFETTGPTNPSSRGKSPVGSKSGSYEGSSSRGKQSISGDRSNDNVGRSKQSSGSKGGTSDYYQKKSGSTSGPAMKGTSRKSPGSSGSSKSSGSSSGKKSSGVTKKSSDSGDRPSNPQKGAQKVEQKSGNDGGSGKAAPQKSAPPSKSNGGSKSSGGKKGR